MRIADTRLLVCPLSQKPLRWEGTNLELTLVDGTLQEPDTGRAWAVVDGLPRLFDEANLKGTDRLLRHIHDGLPAAHRPLLRVGLPLLQGGGTEAALNEALLEQLRLGELERRSDRPVRILEIGVGTGTQIDQVRAALPGGLHAEYWGVDLSETLLRRCRQRWSGHALLETASLVVADAHALPFPDGSFDRVFHVGGFGRFDDPGRVLAEMARVAAPQARVVVIGKRLDPREEQAPFFQAAYRLLTLHEPEVPVERLPLPAGTTKVAEEQLSRFFFVFGLRRD